jgi:hypothetical protein
MGACDGIASWIIAVGSIVIVISIHLFIRGWSPGDQSEFVLAGPSLKTEYEEETKGKNDKDEKDNTSDKKTHSKTLGDNLKAEEEEIENDLFAMNNNGWRCVCESGFLPPGMLKSFGSAEALIRLGAGQCYHKNAR